MFYTLETRNAAGEGNTRVFNAYSTAITAFHVQRANPENVRVRLDDEIGGLRTYTKEESN